MVEEKTNYVKAVGKGIVIGALLFVVGAVAAPVLPAIAPAALGALGFAVGVTEELS